MSGSGGANSSWTILTPEETVSATLRPVMAEHHEESHTGCEGNGQPAESVVSEADGLSVEDTLVSEERRAKLNGDESTDHQAFVPTPVVDSSVPSSLEALGSVIPSSESEGLSEGLALPTSDTDAFSDTCTHISPSLNEPPASVLSTETLGGMEPVQEPALYPLHEELHQEQEESVPSCRMTDFDNQTEVGEEKTELTQEDEEPALRRRRRSLLATLEQIGRREEEEEGQQDFQLPRREDDNDSVLSLNKCILGAIILLGLGTIFLSERDYGIGEMNDSEVPGKVPPDAPVEPDRTELLNMLAKGDQQLALLQAQLQAHEEELKVVKGQAAEGVAEQLYWAAVEQENGRLKEAVASLLALQEENERLKRQLESFPALQKELESLRSTGAELKPSSASEAASAPVKQTSLPPSGQSEDHRHGTAGILERDAKKPQHEQREGEMKEKYDLGEKTKWKGRQKPEWKEGEKKDLEHGGRTEGKEERKSRKREEKQKKYSEEIKQRKDREWKKEKVSRGDEGKPWKAREGKGWKEDKDWKRGKQWRDEEERDWKGTKGHREEWKEERERKKMKQGFEESGSDRKNDRERREWKEDKNWKGGKQWRDEEERDWKEAKDHREERKKVKDGFQESGDEKDGVLKDKGERKEWKKTGDWKNKHTRDVKEKGERKQWSENDWKGGSKDFDEEWRAKKRWHNGESKNAKQWKTQDERNRKSEDGGDEGDERTLGKRAWPEMKREASKYTSNYAEWKKDKKNFEKCEDERGCFENQKHYKEHLWRHGKPPHMHRRPSLDQPEYWIWQRARLQHSPRLSMSCDSLETCAQAEGLLPVPLDQFETLLQEYLAKAEEAGVDASKRETLQKLSAEFFTDGMFVHDQISFQDFVEDLEDILEDMLEEEESDAGGDSAIKEHMDGFKQEAMRRFLAEGARGSEESIEQGRRKESKRR